MRDADERFMWIRDEAVVEQLHAVERAIAARPAIPPELSTQLRSARSKRLRPAVLLLCARACGARLDARTLAAATAVELVHEGTLYHDDIVDRVRQRRGEPTARSRFGAGIAAAVGSRLFYDGVALCSALPDPIRREIGDAAGRVCRGQVREVQLMGTMNVAVRERVGIMLDKTASLFRLAARVGGLLGTAPVRRRAALERFATRFGLCFQLADDLNDLVAPQGVLGRPPGADLRDGVYTLPVLMALESGAPGRSILAALLADLFRDDGAAAVDAARRQICELGGVSRSVDLLRCWSEGALRSLRVAPVLGSRAAEVALYGLVERVVKPLIANGRRAAFDGGLSP